MARARWALEVAAAGIGHHLGLLGSGTAMLAERLPSLLPDLNDNDAVAVTAPLSAAGLLHPADALVRRPPFLAPHHSASLSALTPWGVCPSGAASCRRPRQAPGAAATSESSSAASFHAVRGSP